MKESGQPGRPWWRLPWQDALLLTLSLGAAITTVVVDPGGEGFVRGMNVVVTWVLTSAAVGLGVVGNGLHLAWTAWRAEDRRGWWSGQRRSVVITGLAALVPVLDLVIIRIKAVLAA